jgi:hypothetical protein
MCRSTPKNFQLNLSSLSIVRDEQILRWNGMKKVPQSSRETAGKPVANHRCNGCHGHAIQFIESLK